MNNPPGSPCNPSGWSHRLPVVGLALGGFLIAGYLGLYQMGVLPSVWEPFFGNGSQRILHSALSRMLPVPDSVLGATGYLLDAAAGLIGGSSRWKTRPWIVIVLGILVCSMAAVGLLLILLQGAVFRAWCTLCLASALISLAMVPLALPEVLVTIRHLLREHRSGRSWPEVLSGAAQL